MIDVSALTSRLRRHPIAAAGLYAAMVGSCVLTAWQSLADIVEERSAALAALATADVLATRGPMASVDGAGDTMSASPFIESTTIALAGAVLLQRVQEAARRAAGDVQSSQVEAATSRERPGLITATFTIEAPADSVSGLLYDLESGMPFIFIDELVIQPTGADSGRLRLILGISAQRQP